MLAILLTGVPVIVLCLIMQAVFVAKGLRYYARFKQAHRERASQWQDIQVLSMVMLLMLLGIFVQMAIWACLFRVLGEFSDFPTALYHSAVNFATLGYGDMVMSQRWRVLGPIEAANGILMFGVATSVMTAAVIDVINGQTAALERDGEPLDKP
ncbi:MAG TPA: potassium channel family protein [Thermomonas sp.]|nr:potassium channel family protein [Thermomonas sp.]